MGLAKRTWPSEGFEISGRTISSDFAGSLMMSLLELAFGMRSVIAAVCTLPLAGEEAGAGASDRGLAEFGFVTAVDDSGVASAAELTGGAAVRVTGATVEARDVLGPDAVCVDAKDASESRKYHPPLAAAIIRPAAIAIHALLPP